jgi:hypothetical protein
MRHSHFAIHRFQFVVAMLLLVCASGCVFLDEPPLHRTLKWSEVPPQVQQAFQQHFPEVKNPEIEQFGSEPENFIFKLPNGERRMFDSQGNLLPGRVFGGVI